MGANIKTPFKIQPQKVDNETITQIELFRLKLGKTRYYVRSIKRFRPYKTSDSIHDSPNSSGTIVETITCDAVSSSPTTWRKLRKLVKKNFDIKLPRSANSIIWNRHTFYYNTSTAIIKR